MAIDVASVDQYRAEVDDLTAAILDGTRPRLDLAFSRGTIAALVDLDRAARAERRADDWLRPGRRRRLRRP